MERFAWPKNLSSSRKHAIKELLHGQKSTKKRRDLFDAHSQAGNNTRQPLFAEDLVVNVLKSFSNSLSESISAESDQILQLPTHACVWSEDSDEESINSPFWRSFGDDRKMEDPQLKEGKAYSYHDHDHGFDDGIDPDVSLYIEEKLQQVLGHFRKDFEGGISAKNLGAKFGGYGTFFPVDRIDPDVSLYIEEKLQQVLGHFRKDFEGGVSAEILGPKFGGYGSFLPAVLRSPPRGQNYGTPRSTRASNVKKAFRYMDKRELSFHRRQALREEIRSERDSQLRIPQDKKWS